MSVMLLDSYGEKVSFKIARKGLIPTKIRSHSYEDEVSL